MVRRPYYNNLTFHRIIPGFMIQGGDPEGTGMGGLGFTFADEFNPSFATTRPASSPWPIAAPTPTADNFSSRCVGTSSRRQAQRVRELVEGPTTLRAIAKVETNGKAGMPLKPVVIKSVRIERVS